MNKRKLGYDFERRALEFIINKKYIVLEKNFYFNGGEIDIIAKDNESLVFIEVKYRSSCRYGFAIEAINNSKLNRIKKGIYYYMSINNESYSNIRIEAILFDGDRISHIQLS